MSNLLIDIGNSSTKIAFSEHSHIKSIFRCQQINISELIKRAECENIESIVVSSVVGNNQELYSQLSALSNHLIIVNSNITLPFKNRYSTPSTLGSDRICAICGAHSLFPGEDCIIFDFGTAVTIDFLNRKGEYEGGNISLGLNTRFNAISQYTKQLPLLSPPKNIKDIGDSTSSAIESGIILGIMFEIEGYIRQYPCHKCIFTGGDSIFFAEKLKNPIFVVYNLVLKGLAQIAQINA